MKIKALVYLVAFLLIEQASATGQQPPRPTPVQAQHLSRDFFGSDSQDFFKQGQDVIEREIQILMKRQRASTEPVLKVNPQPRIEKDRSPNNKLPSKS